MLLVFTDGWRIVSLLLGCNQCLSAISAALCNEGFLVLFFLSDRCGNQGLMTSEILEFVSLAMQSVGSHSGFFVLRFHAAACALKPYGSRSIGLQSTSCSLRFLTDVRLLCPSAPSCHRLGYLRLPSNYGAGCSYGASARVTPQSGGRAKKCRMARHHAHAVRPRVADGLHWDDGGDLGDGGQSVQPGLCRNIGYSMYMAVFE